MAIRKAHFHLLSQSKRVFMSANSVPSTTESPAKRDWRFLREHWSVYRENILPLLLLTLLNAAVLVVYPLLLKSVIDSIQQQLSVETLLKVCCVSGPVRSLSFLYLCCASVSTSKVEPSI